MAARQPELHMTRTFAAGAFEFTVATATREDRRLVESLFQDLPPAPAGGEPAGFSVLRLDAGGEAWQVDGPRVREQPPLPMPEALAGLISAVNVCALDAEPESLHLHAGAATQDGKAVVVAAQRNTGKTTTIAHLVARGWGFVTDEMVRLHRGDRAVGGFPKPVSIKPGGYRLLGHLEPWRIPPGAGGTELSFVPMGASGATMSDGGDARLVVLLRRPASDDMIGEPVVRRLHPADAVVALIEETLDAERFGAAALRLAELAAATHCYAVTIGSPEATADRIEELFALDPVDRLDVSALPPREAVSRGVVTVGIGDRAIIHDTSSGRVLALDDAGARVWRKLGGWTDDDGINVHGPVIRPFVDQLRAFGVLAGTA